jgi:hypothetical protein
MRGIRITGLCAFHRRWRLQGSGWPGRPVCGLTPTPASTHIFAALGFAAQSPGLQKISDLLTHYTFASGIAEGLEKGRDVSRKNLTERLDKKY